MATSSSAQAFGWALPTSEQSYKKDKNDSPKPIANPLLKVASNYNNVTSFANGVQSPPQARAPFSQVDNTTLRRRKQSLESTKTIEPVFLPPKSSLLATGALYLELPETIIKSEEDHKNAHNGALESWERDDNNFQRWVVVFGYATRNQFDQIIHRFESFGRVTGRRGICKPGSANWVAFQYESEIQAEKALCQQAGMLSNGVLIGVTRMNYSLKSSLDWTEQSNLGSTAKSLSSSSQTKNKTWNDVDILLDRNVNMPLTDGNKSVCQRVVEFLFGWN